MNLLLDALNDEELKYLVQDDIGFFLEPIKQNERSYIRYSAQLGTKKKDSVLVKKNLPRIAVSLYQKKDHNYVLAMEKKAEFYTNLLINIVNDTLGKEYNKNDIKSLSDEEIVDVLRKIKDGEGNRIELDLLWILLKLVGITNVEERKKSISKLFEIDNTKQPEINIQADKEAEQVLVNSSADKQEVAVKRTRTKKLTAEEKAAKMKAAIAAKEKNNEKEQQSVDKSEEQHSDSITQIIDSDNNAVSVFNEKKENERVAKYIGVINIKTNFYNYTPIGYYQRGVFYAYSERELDSLLPKSNKHNINFYYNFWDEQQTRFMEQKFKDGQLVLLECEIDELEENRNSAGELNATGYKIDAVESWKYGRIMPLSRDGLYTVLPKTALLDEIESKIETKGSIRIEHEGITEGEEVFINLGEGFYGGPFQVKYASQNYTYFISLQNTEGKYCISGYNYSDCNKVVIVPSLDVENWIGYHSWNYYVVKDDVKPIVKDFITDRCLLESFKEALGQTGGIDYNNLDVDGILEEISGSLIIGNSIPEEIRKQRIERIRNILSDKTELSQFYAESSELICDLLIKNNDNKQIDELLSGILNRNPELLDKVQGIRAIQAKLDNKRAELEQLEMQYAETKMHAEKVQKDEASDSTNNKNAETEIDERIKEKQAEYDAVINRLKVADDLDQMLVKISKIKDDVSYYEKHKDHLMNDAKNLESKFVELINGNSEKMADITFDGFMSSKMLKAAAEWENKIDTEELEKKVSILNDAKTEAMSTEEVVEYIVRTIQISRPGYSKNTIINILTCLSQGFLTVFSGMPGCGKTSICNIVSRVLGLNDYKNVAQELSDICRYISVSVERGWTSKRDFIGYYNPLTKAFEESNREVFDGLKFLDMEHKRKNNKWPFVILLDEANLSPMEYYWADFMNICDDLTDNSSINLGNDNVFHIPETLHFLATINNDHTTETLSPRLIDRAWVITLPRNTTIQASQDIPDELIKNLTWNDMKNAFCVMDGATISFDRETKILYDGIKEKLAKQELYISPRVDIAILKYWAVSSKIMEEDEYGNSASIVSLDYAVSQKILPKLIGSGDAYEEWLKELMAYCNNKGLSYSASIIDSIINRGNRQMKYYQFFN